MKKQKVQHLKMAEEISFLFHRRETDVRIVNLKEADPVSDP